MSEVGRVSQQISKFSASPGDAIDPSALPSIESRTQQIGRSIFAFIRENGDSAAEGSWLEERMMDLGMRDERVKAQLFRFIDVLPVLTSAAQMNGHLREYMMPVRDRLPMHGGRLLSLIPRRGWLAERFAGLTRYSTRRMARRFIAATDVAEAVQAVLALRRRGLAFTIDLLGEAVLSETEAEQYQKQYLELISGLTERAAHWPAVDLIDRGDGGELPRVNVSVKLSSLFSQFDPIDPAGTSQAVFERLRPILRLARARGAFINIDMEQYAYKDATLRIFRDVFSEPEFRDWPDVGIAIQAYLTDTGDDLRDLARWAERRGTPVWVRLVKGAYWDFESIIAQQNHWNSPVFRRKAETDANFEAQTAFLMERHDLLRPAIASHNVRSIAHALALAEVHKLPPGAFEFQMLFGMADPIKSALTALGHRVRIYTPYGQLLPGMAYLVRRLLENTSNESFLRAGFHDHRPEGELLMNPIEMLRRNKWVVFSSETYDEVDRIAPFSNWPLTDFSRDDNRLAMQQAVANIKPMSFPLHIGGRAVETGEWIESLNPSHAARVVGRVSKARVQDANDAIAAAGRAFPKWRDTSPRARARHLFHAARLLVQHRWELAALEVHETAKQWREADADVAEAIDYCEYYGREMLRLAEPQRRDVPGEDNEYFYEPRGVVVTIAPWNFPLAILWGMTAAALVTGNTVVMKPAEQSPLIACRLMEIFEQAGFPPGVVNYLPGVGEGIGPTLVGHPDVAMIAFTGSRAVGLAIQRQAAETPPGQQQIKKVITELGGKNAVIVDDDADLDEAVHGVVASAFGYAGQKCSACSRVIVHEAIYEQFLARLIEATRSLRIGPAEDPGNFVGPVIDKEAQQRILRAIEKGKAEARLAYSADLGALMDEGCYVPPTIFADVPESASIAQEEIFGPVLCVMRTVNLDEALRIANGTPYALTGGLFSRSPAHIEQVRREFRVGNLYINRKITGALVDRQPFGGMKLSGTGSKAGGPDYLLHFVIPRTITENTLRRGFAPQAGE